MSETSLTMESLSKEQATELKAAIEKLTSKEEEERLAAQARIDALGANKLDILLAILEKEAEERRKRQRCVVVGFAIYAVLVLAMIIVPMLFGRKPIFDLLKGSGGMVAVVFALLAASAAQKNATRALGEFDDKQTVGAWAMALDYDDKEVVAMARQKLPQLLTQLNASDAPLLDNEQRGILYNALHKRPDKKNPDITLHQSILKALEQIGDEAALPHVEKLAQGEGLAEKFSELQSAAKDCLPFLKARVEQLRASQTLLRASSASEAPSYGSDVLLRPALNAGATPAQELLRAADNEPMERKTVLNRNPVNPENPVNPVYLTVKGGE